MSHNYWMRTPHTVLTIDPNFTPTGAPSQAEIDAMLATTLSDSDLRLHEDTYMSPSVRTCMDCRQPWPCDAFRYRMLYERLLPAASERAAGSGKGGE